MIGMLRSLGPAELNAKGKDLCGQMRPLMAKYPFSPNSQAQATLEDINSIFEPKKGALWAFYDAKLQKLLQRTASQFAPASERGMTVNPAFVAMMNRAGDFTAAAYPNGATDPQLHLQREAGDEPGPGQRQDEHRRPVRDLYAIEPGGETVRLAGSKPAARKLRSPIKERRMSMGSTLGYGASSDSSRTPTSAPDNSSR